MALTWVLQACIYAYTVRLVMHIDVNIIAFQRIDIGSRGLEKILTYTRRCL